MIPVEISNGVKEALHTGDKVLGVDAYNFNSSLFYEMNRKGEIYAWMQFYGKSATLFGEKISTNSPTDDISSGVVTRIDTSGKMLWWNIFSTTEIFSAPSYYEDWNGLKKDNYTRLSICNSDGLELVLPFIDSVGINKGIDTNIYTYNEFGNYNSPPGWLYVRINTQGDVVESYVVDDEATRAVYQRLLLKPYST